MQLQPYHQRVLTRLASQSSPSPQPDPYPDYARALNEATTSRWYPLFILLRERFRGNKPFTDYEVGALIGLREEYENGVSRKG